MVSSLQIAVLATLVVTTVAAGIVGAVYTGGRSISAKADRLSVNSGVVEDYVTVEIRHDNGSMLERRPLSGCVTTLVGEACGQYRIHRPAGSPSAPAVPEGRPIASDGAQSDLKSPS